MSLFFQDNMPWDQSYNLSCVEWANTYELRFSNTIYVKFRGIQIQYPY
jgi:hypothetical protein